MTSYYTFVYLCLEDLGRELEESLNANGLKGQILFVKCDITSETDVQVDIFQ